MNFDGATTRSKHDVEVAMYNYDTQKNHCRRFIKSEIERAEAEYKPHPIAKLWRGTTLEQWWKNSDSYDGFSLWLWNKDFITITEDQRKLLISNGFAQFEGYWGADFDSIYESIKSLSYGGTVYLNPRQSDFVEKWSKQSPKDL